MDGDRKRESWRSEEQGKRGPLQRLKALALKAAFWKKTVHNTTDGRRVDVRTEQLPAIDPRTGLGYIDNTIRSSKYTIWSFLPKQLYAQFPGKIANCYFLFISILQLIPGLSTTGTFTTLAPLLIFVAISMGKEGWEDNRRHKLDKTENTSLVLRLKRSPDSNGPSEWEEVEWQTLHVGDIVRVQRNQAVPADIIVLHVDGAEDTAFIETMALDGETNLKNKVAPTLLINKFKSADDIIWSDTFVDVEHPNLDLYNFSGNITVEEETLPLTNDDIVYRGSILRNTKEVIGLMIYSGEECKIRMNATKNPRVKAPALQYVVNRIVIFIVLLVLILAVFLTGAYLVWRSQEARSWYLIDATVPIFPIFISFVIILNTLIPLSLYVSMEVVKLFQVWFMIGDIEMYDPVTNTPMEARTSTINEELGQVHYVFSDKTGTLTDNIMNFRKMSVAGTAWIHEENPEAGGEGAKVSDDQSRRGAAEGQGTELSGNTDELLEYITETPSSQFARSAHFFLLSMAICHSCMSEETDGEINYQSTSPDEVALVKAAQEMGYIFIDRRAGKMRVRVTSQGITQTYEVLQVLEFTSKRKRMSAIVRMPDGKVCLFSKGADSTIMGLLRQADLARDMLRKVERKATMRRQSTIAPLKRRSTLRQSIIGDSRRNLTFSGNGFSSPTERAMSPHRVAGSFAPDKVDMDDAIVFENCFQHINNFATDGLRTLLYGYRFLSDQEFAEWNRMYHEASTSLNDRQEKMDEVADLIEQELDLSGATAIEDLLQKGVPATIERLRRAHIKIWVLTGDKRETAINIGRSCGLIKEFSTVVILDHETGGLLQQIQAGTELRKSDEAAHFCIVVDGQSLSIIESDETLYAQLHEFAIIADSVLCCRASPSQKASLVKSIRQRVKGSITLAIGDGANDVAMLQEAHIGIGIAGREGLQAARTSDYSIAQFRFLAKLLLVHGRWNYLRVCKYTLGTFWKEMLFYLTQAMYQHANGYTGTSLYEPWSLSMFNALFTSLAVIFLGIFEKDLHANTLMAVPELYSYGQKNRGFSLKLYLAWSCNAAILASGVYYTTEALFGNSIFTIDNGLYGMGALSYTAIVLIINLKLQFWEPHLHTLTTLFAVIVTITGWFLWNIVLSEIYKDNVIYNVSDGLLKRWGRNALWWLTVVLIVAAAGAFEVILHVLRKAVRPSDTDDFQELEKIGYWAERWREEAVLGEGRKAGDIGNVDGEKEKEMKGRRDENGDIEMNDLKPKEKRGIGGRIKNLV